MKREIRYAVFKMADVRGLDRSDQAALLYLAAKVDVLRMGRGKKPLACVVIEDDWPEYEPTWRLLEKRVDAQEASRRIVEEGESMPVVCTPAMDEMAMAICMNFPVGRCAVCGKGEAEAEIGRCMSLPVCLECYKSGRLIEWLDAKVKRKEANAGS